MRSQRVSSGRCPAAVAEQLQKYETCIIGPSPGEGWPNVVSPWKAVTAYLDVASPSRAHLEFAGLVPLRLPESAEVLFFP